MKFQSLFITGTDTGVGKTTVASAIASGLRTRGHRVGVLKPIETGCPIGADGQLQPADALQLRYFSMCAAEPATVCPVMLREPLAPLVAARREATSVDLGLLVDAHASIAAAHDVTLVEGAGGLLVPIVPQVTFADLAARLDAPVVVVVGSKLGAINHTLLTLRHAQSLGLRVLGYIINFLSSEADLAARTNVDLLTEWCGPPLGVVPYLGTPALTDDWRRRLAEVAATHIRLADLLVPC